MSEKTKAFMDRAKTQTIGCEIEMAEITRNMAIKTVARYFGTLDTVHHDGGQSKRLQDTSEHSTRFTTTAEHTTLGAAKTRRADFGR